MTTSTLRGRSVLVGFVAMAMLIVACSSDSEPDRDDASAPSAEGSSSPTSAADASEQPEPDRDGTLRLGYTVPPTQWDPIAGTSQGISWNYFPPIYDRLLEVMPDGTIAPMLATDFEFGPDNRTLVLTLRQDVTFSDGEAFDATVAKANLDRAKAAAGSLAANALRNVESVTVVDDYTIELALSDDPSAAEVPYDLALESTLGIVSPAALADPATLATTPVGSGLYRLVEQGQDRAVYERVPGYWDETLDASAPERLEIIAFAEQPTRINALLSGQVDAILLNSGTTAELESIPDDFSITSYEPRFRAQGLSLNTARPALADVDARRAIEAALNRDELSGLFASCPTSAQLSAEGSVGYVDELSDQSVVEQDLETAAELAESSGLADQPLTLLTSQVQQAAATVVLGQLTAAGLDVELVVTPANQTLATWREGGADMLFVAASGPNPDPGGVVQDWVLGLNNPGEVDADLQALVDEARGLELGTAQRDEAFQAVNRYMVDNPQFIPMCIFGADFISRPEVLNLDQQYWAPVTVVFDTRYLQIAADD